MPQATVPNYNPPLEGARSRIVYEAGAPTDAAPTEVKVGIGTEVPLRRQTEIVAAIMFLANGIRDRRLLEGEFKGSAMATAVNIDEITASNLRTAANLTAVSFQQDDIVICMGSTATDNQHVLMLDTAIEQMVDVLLENFKNQSPEKSA